MELARAVNQEIVGPNALVGTRISLWYGSGASRWFDFSRDVLWKPETPADLKAYFGTFDAIAESSFISQETFNKERKSIISWYLDDTLKLKGFYFNDLNQRFAQQLLDPRFARLIQGYSDATLSQLLLSVVAPSSIEGYAYKKNQLYHFKENASGSHVFVAMTCPYGFLEDGSPVKAEFFNRFALPDRIPSDRFPTEKDVSTFLTRKEDYQPDQLTPHCQIKQEVIGTLQPVESAPFLDKLHRHDSPMRFYQTFGEARASQAQIIGKEPIFSGETNWKKWQPANPEVQLKFKANDSVLKIKTNRSTYDFQIQSLPFQLMPNQTYRIDLKAWIERGGLGIHVLDLDRKHRSIHSVAFCEPQSQSPLETQFVFDSGVAENVEIAVSNCSQNQPNVSKFELKQLTVWPVEIPFNAPKGKPIQTGHNHPA
jgi:hypothetical protein